MAPAASKESPELWHKHFGHLGFDSLFKLKKGHPKHPGISVPGNHFMKSLKSSSSRSRPMRHTILAAQAASLTFRRQKLKPIGACDT